MLIRLSQKENTPVRNWLLAEVDPQVFAAVEAAAADRWLAQSDVIRLAVIAWLRAEGRLPPRPTLRAAKAAETMATR
jgi:hypothetical protein